MVSPTGVGSGTHIHWSLLDAAGRPATHDATRPHGLSDAAEGFCARTLAGAVCVLQPFPASQAAGGGR